MQYHTQLPLQLFYSYNNVQNPDCTGHRGIILFIVVIKLRCN